MSGGRRTRRQVRRGRIVEGLAGGRGDCGSSFRLHGGQLDMAHEHECPASDEAMAEVLERHGWEAHYIDGRTA